LYTIGRPQSSRRDHIPGKCNRGNLIGDARRWGVYCWEPSVPEPEPTFVQQYQIAALAGSIFTLFGALSAYRQAASPTRVA
jgi:hypothetical protein